MGRGPRAQRVQTQAAIVPLRADGRERAVRHAGGHERGRRQTPGRGGGAPRVRGGEPLAVRQELEEDHPPRRGEQDPRVRGAPELLVTHTDAPELFVWDTETQPHRKTIASAADSEADRERAPSTPDLALVGHEDPNAEFALAVRRDAFEVASGGKDAQVLLWNVEDHDGGAVWRSGPRATRRRLKSRALSSAARIRRARRRSSRGSGSRAHRHGGGWRVPPPGPAASCARWRATAR